MLLPGVSEVYSLEDIQLVPNLATRACGGTVVYPGMFCGPVEGGLFLPCVSNMYSLKDIWLVPNMATRACGDAVVYPGGFYYKYHEDFVFYPVSLICIVWKMLG